MKKLLKLLTIFSFIMILNSCNKEDELPPRNVSTDIKIYIDTPQLTTEERAIIEERANEYELAKKDL